MTLCVYTLEEGHQFVVYINILWMMVYFRVVALNINSLIFSNFASIWTFSIF
jgi:hypothetical protein